MATPSPSAGEVYVVVAASGAYEDRTEAMVAGYADELTAQQHVERATLAVKLLAEELLEIEATDEEDTKAEQDWEIRDRMTREFGKRNEALVGAGFDDPSTTFDYLNVPLLAKVPRALRRRSA